MQTRRPIRWLRVNYCVGVLVDAFMLFPLLDYRIAAALFRIRNFNPDAGFRYASALAATLMGGWTCLLLRAAARPIERRGSRS